MTPTQAEGFGQAIVGGIDADGNQIDLDGVDGADIAISVNSRIAVLNNTLQEVDCYEV